MQDKVAAVHQGPTMWVWQKPGKLAEAQGVDRVYSLEAGENFLGDGMAVVAQRSDEGIQYRVFSGFGAWTKDRDAALSYLGPRDVDTAYNPSIDGWPVRFWLRW